MINSNRWLVALVLIAACGGAAAAPAESVATGESLTTLNVTPPSSTSEQTDTSTPTPQQEASTGQMPVDEAATTTLPEFGPDVPPTPIARLASFRWEVATVVTDDRRRVVYVESDGEYQDGAFDCDVKVTRLNRTAVLSLAGTADGRQYLDLSSGRGLTEVTDDADTDDNEIYEANLAFCPGAADFWKGLGVEEELISSPHRVERNNETTRRLDLTAIPAIAGFLSPLGPPGQTTYDRYTLFITESGGWINAMEMSAKVSAEAIGELADREPGPDGRLDVKIDILNANNASIEVEDPDPIDG